MLIQSKLKKFCSLVFKKLGMDDEKANDTAEILVEDDMITFYEIHEMFDTLNMFDSKHEKDVSQKLTNIGDGLESLMDEIRDVGDQISNSLQGLSYVTEESNRQLTNQLSEIDSTLKVENLISTINTYQNFKTNKKLNS